MLCSILLLSYLILLPLLTQDPQTNIHRVFRTKVSGLRSRTNRSPDENLLRGRLSFVEEGS